ncbi:hypothetical protein CVT25_003596 [Psilocybe cyanescens]|uniref:Uncharacterized protein n=1 Tax=Psilocybe cyanescens TaxID=93625 RepID=A0A409WPE2_PSICY|nr:hypothetical protein CVT25_003596 [Psilocybe cyanescens]
MSSPGSIGPPVSFQQAVIKDGLNSTMLFTFLMGVYTNIYIGTLYLYLTRRAAQRSVIVLTITTIYLLSVVQLGLQWYFLVWSFINHGDTKESIFISSLSVPQPLAMASVVVTFVTITLSDGLLIWRCFHVWNRSLSVISLSLFLALAEIALFIASLITQKEVEKQESPPLNKLKIMNGTQAGGYLASFLTTLVTTGLIAYKIYSVSNEDKAARGNFKHILDIFVQSGVIYALALLVTACESLKLLTLVSTNGVTSTQLFGLQSYSSALLGPIAGIAPTGMVARVVLAPAANAHLSTNHHLSGLQFHGNSTRQSESGMRTDTILVMGQENNLNAEGEK